MSRGSANAYPRELFDVRRKPINDPRLCALRHRGHPTILHSAPIHMRRARIQARGLEGIDQIVGRSRRAASSMSNTSLGPNEAKNTVSSRVVPQGCPAIDRYRPRARPSHFSVSRAGSVAWSRVGKRKRRCALDGAFVEERCSAGHGVNRRRLGDAAATPAQLNQRAQSATQHCSENSE